MPGCEHFLARKNRPCGMATRTGAVLCGPHSPAYSASCAWCGTALQPHVVHAHEARCPRAASEAAVACAPWYQRDANRPTAAAPPADGGRFGAGQGEEEVPFSDLLCALEAGREPVRDAPDISAAARAAADAIRARWAAPRTSYAKLEPRHFAQCAGLAALLDVRGAGAAVAEAGAGRAYVALFAAEALALRGASAPFFAVDRGANRNKMDGALRAMQRRGEGVLTFARARVDLRHLRLAGAPGFRAAEHPRVVAKHACGAATDAVVAAADNFCREWRAGRTSGSCRAVLAPCCRSICEWEAVHGGAGEWHARGGQAGFAQAVARAAWGLNPADKGKEKARVGELCRNAIDAARVRWLRAQGWDAYLVRYVPEEVTSENVAIVAHWDVAQQGNN